MRLAISMMIRVLAAAVLGAAVLAPPASAAELAPLPKVTTPRLYVFDCGTLIYNKPEDYNLKRDEVKATHRRKSSVRAKVEHVFGVIKRVFGFQKVCYRGLAKNLHRLEVTAALANLFLSRRRLLNA
jgi:hypothetical protein